MGWGGFRRMPLLSQGDTTGGASVDFSTGLYTAGPLPGTTTVHMADSSLPVELTADALVTVQGGGVPAMSSPTPGSTLSGSTETFTYMANGAAVHRVVALGGHEPRTKDIYTSGSLGTATSHTVNGLPTDGATLHVRLWWKISGVWSAADYTYTAFMTAGGGVPAMSSPTPGWSTLSGSTETFTYMANGAAVTEWWLWVGTSPRTKDIYTSGSLGTATSHTGQRTPDGWRHPACAVMVENRRQLGSSGLHLYRCHESAVVHQSCSWFPASWVKRSTYLERQWTSRHRMAALHR